MVGLDFFPSVDTGQMRLHVRAPTGLRIEDTEAVVERVEEEIRELIPAASSTTINDNIGLPTFYNLAFVPTDNVGGQDAEILIALKPDHQPSDQYKTQLRAELRARFPEERFYFMPADVVTQVLNFGVPAAIDVQVDGPDAQAAYRIARQLFDDVRQHAGHRGRAHRPGGRSSGAAHRRRSPARVAAQRHLARRGQQHADVAELERCWCRPATGSIPRRASTIRWWCRRRCRRSRHSTISSPRR